MMLNTNHELITKYEYHLLIIEADDKNKLKISYNKHLTRFKKKGWELAWADHHPFQIVMVFCKIRE
jgi:hypothetical protein